MTAVAKKIPENVITGFLGVGKTTSILQLLANKPAEVKWAVLVNEFGEIGIDGAIIEDSGVAIKEVMGGCFCCTNGGSVENGLGMLLMTQRPDRVLIEPTSLGHVRRILRK